MVSVSYSRTLGIVGRYHDGKSPLGRGEILLCLPPMARVRVNWFAKTYRRFRARATYAWWIVRGKPGAF